MRRLVVLCVGALLLSSCVLEYRDMPEKCDFDERFSCQGSLTEDGVFLNVTNTREPLSAAELAISNGCFGQASIGEWITNQTKQVILCDSQLLDEKLSASLKLAYEENGIEKESLGVLRLVRH